MTARSDPQHGSRRPHRARLRSAIIATAMVITAALAGAAGAGRAVAGADPAVPPSAGKAAIPERPAPADPVYGHDVGSRQGGKVDWSQAAADGVQFVYVKATEGSYYTNPHFARDYTGAGDAGLIRGAYHFAIPSQSSGTAQADYFVSNGGAWSPGTRTLPGALDIEYNPHGPRCYGLSQSAMVSWIGSFVDEYHARTGRWPVIYTATDWWSACTGNYGGFAANDPLWIAHYASSAGRLPAGWSNYTFWQYADHGTFPGDQDIFNGALDRLRALADSP